MKILHAQNDIVCAENFHYCTLYRENLSFLLLRSLRYVLRACSTANISVFDVSCNRAKNRVNNVSTRFVHFLDLTQKKHCKCFLVQQCCKEHMCFGTFKATWPWEEQCLANFLIPVQALPRSGVNMFDFGFLNFNGRFSPVCRYGNPHGTTHVQNSVWHWPIALGHPSIEIYCQRYQ